ncbi:unnamed protein product [Macrosiphum euphorbiae]|uniref:Uncharacterized protein n=1 Tax=Macrosiphum euphorbiae TaxID=13131 RepID=A0AAV0WGX5_9HEMI|nr:unnamed protein product [Macrosiphum euphorbiae]
MINSKPTTRSGAKLQAVASPKVVSSPASSSPSNDDIMTTLLSFRTEFSDSFKKLSLTQDNQFKELKNDIVQLSSLLAELKAENNTLKGEVVFLKDKVLRLESLDSPAFSSTVVSQVFQETFERERCSTNLLVYSVPESSAESTAQRITDDKSTFENIVIPLIGNLPAQYKLVRLGKAQANNTRPLKIIFESKECASKLLATYYEVKKKGTNFPPNFRIVKDKTLLQRTLLRNCHSELERRSQDGEVGLQIVHINGLPKVVFSNPRNGNFNQRPTFNNP